MTFHSHPDETVGTYVLGLESDDSRAALRAHLDVCEPCRAEWQRLRELTPFLARAVDVQTADG